MRFACRSPCMSKSVGGLMISLSCSSVFQYHRWMRASEEGVIDLATSVAAMERNLASDAIHSFQMMIRAKEEVAEQCEEQMSKLRDQCQAASGLHIETHFLTKSPR